MVQVIQVKPVKKNFLVVLKKDKEEEYIVSEELLVEFRLLKGKELTNSDYKKFKEAYKSDELYQKILHFALYKQRCTQDIASYLAKKSIFGNDQEYYLEKLRRSRILDDESYVKNFIHEAFEYKRLGIKKIQYDLKSKKLDEALYQPIINEISTKQIQENIEYLFQKKLHQSKNKSLNRTIQDIKQFIIRKGYNYEMVNLVINQNKEEIASSISEDDALNKDYIAAKKKYSKDKSKEYQNILSNLLRKGYNYNEIKVRMGVKDE